MRDLPRQLLSFALAMLCVTASPVSAQVLVGDRDGTRLNGLQPSVLTPTRLSRVRRHWTSVTDPAVLADAVSSIEWGERAGGVWVGRQDQPADQDAVSAGGRSRLGSILVTAAGAALFGYFLARGSQEVEDQQKARDTKQEIGDFTLFAGAVTLLGTGTVMLLTGS